MSRSSSEPRWSWTQPCCVDCWNERNPRRPAHTMEADTETERCVYCGRWDQSGIYVRTDPATAPYPSTRK